MSMNKNISSIIAAVIAVLLAVLAMVMILSSGQNEVGALALTFSVVSLFLGMVAPQHAMHALVILAAFSDLLKRFLILGSSITELDIVYVLAMSPLLLAGVVLHYLVGDTIYRRHTKSDICRFVICSIVLILVSLKALQGGGGAKSLRGVADYGAFIYLIYVLPLVFPSSNSMLKFARFAICVFVPVAIYGIWQRVYGLAEFELDYLATGLSIESRQLGDINFRPFSTLNSASSLTVVMSSCAMITCICLKYRMLRFISGGLLLCLFVSASIMTFTRAGWVTMMLYLPMVLTLRYRWSTIAMYALGAMSIIAIVCLSDWFLSNLHSWQHDISGDYGRSTQAYRVTTLYDRFLGFSNLKNPENWQPFGVSHKPYPAEYRYEDPAFSHDMLGRFIFRWGYIPFVAVVVSMFIFLQKFHSKLFALEGQTREKLTSVVGAVFALGVSVLAGTYIFQFPANIFLWILVGLAAQILYSNRQGV